MQKRNVSSFSIVRYQISLFFRRQQAEIVLVRIVNLFALVKMFSQHVYSGKTSNDNRYFCNYFKFLCTTFEQNILSSQNLGSDKPAVSHITDYDFFKIRIDHWSWFKYLIYKYIMKTLTCREIKGYGLKIDMTSMIHNHNYFMLFFSFRFWNLPFLSIKTDTPHISSVLT